MNSQQEEKLKGLINTSAILSGQEKNEWLTLLDLMDDKQVGELEKMLTNAQASRPVQSSPSANLKPAPVGNKTQYSIPEPKSISGNPDGLGQMPQLRHIVNVPNNLGEQGSMGAKPSASAINQASFNHLPSAPQKNQSAGFASKLKSIFSEKELSAPAERPELSAPLKSPGPVAEKEKPVDFGLKLKPNLKPATFPPIPPKPPLMPKISGLAAFPKPTPILDDKILQGLKSDVNLTKQTAPLSPARPGAPEKPATIDTIEDLTSFSLKNLQVWDLISLVKKIKALRDEFGYFNVIMSLEKSPAYKAYIATGLKLLNEQSSFEQVGAQSTLPEYLTRAQFEKFTDLLAKIQTS